MYFHRYEGCPWSSSTKPVNSLFDKIKWCTFVCMMTSYSTLIVPNFNSFNATVIILWHFYYTQRTSKTFKWCTKDKPTPHLNCSFEIIPTTGMIFLYVRYLQLTNNIICYQRSSRMTNLLVRNVFSIFLNPFMPSIPFLRHRQTVQTQIRHGRMQQLIRIYNVCIPILID